ALADVPVLAHDGDADVVLFEVQHQAADAVGELDQLARLGLVEAVDARDAVADREHRAGLRDGDLLPEILDLIADDAADFVGTNLHFCLLPKGAGASPWRAGRISAELPSRQGFCISVPCASSRCGAWFFSLPAGRG